MPCMFLQSDNCNTKLNLLHIKTIHSFKITEVIAKLWHVISFKTIPDFVIKQPNVLCNHFVLCCVKIANKLCCKTTFNA